MKKLAAVLIALFLLAGVSTVAEDAYKVGVCQLVQHVALDAATQGFQDALKAKLGDKVVFDVQNASGDSVTCSTIVNGFVSDNVTSRSWAPASRITPRPWISTTGPALPG